MNESFKGGAGGGGVKGGISTHYHDGGAHGNHVVSIPGQCGIHIGGDHLLQIQDLRATFRVEMLLCAQKS